MIGTQITGFERLAAAGMGRLLEHMVAGPYAILSADRADMNPEQRGAARERLKNALRGMGYGWIPTRGAWREEGRDEHSKEDSVFVPGMSPEDADAIGRAFDQDAVIVGDRGTFSFLDLRGDSPVDVERLEDHLVIPDLTSSPDMYTEIGGRKFELRFPDPEEEVVPGGRFSPEGIARVREQLDRIGRPRPAVHENAFLAHAYAGRAPSYLLPASGLRFAGSAAEHGNRFGGLPLVALDRMAYHIPFVARLVEVLPEFDPSPRWGEPIPVPPDRGDGVRTAGIMDSAGLVPAESTAYEDALSGHSQFQGGVGELFSTQRPGTNMKGFDSLYLGPSGTIFMLRPHTHDATARSVLRSVHPELPAAFSKGHLSGGYTHTDLTQASGIQRFQIYRDGMGVTVEMSRPPNRRQLDAIRDIYMMTPMERFVAEITLGGKLISHLTSFGQLVHFVNNWDPDDPSSVTVLDPRLGELYDRSLAH